MSGFFFGFVVLLCRDFVAAGDRVTQEQGAPKEVFSVM
jgi:hypothetical protein